MSDEKCCIDNCPFFGVDGRGRIYINGKPESVCPEHFEAILGPIGAAVNLECDSDEVLEQAALEQAEENLTHGPNLVEGESSRGILGDRTKTFE